MTGQLGLPAWWTRVVLYCFAGSILLPQGVGLALPGLPNLDLPRVAAVAVSLLLVLSVCGSGRLLTHGASRTVGWMAFVAVAQVISAALSGTPSASMMWAVGNWLAFWGLTIAVIHFCGRESDKEWVIRALLWVGLALAVWSIGELVTQQKLFPRRNLWSDGGVFSLNLRRQVAGGLTLPAMSIGPFAQNLALAGTLAALGGLLLVRGGRATARGRIGIVAFVVGMLATQSRAGIVAMLVMLALAAHLAGKFRDRWRVGVFALFGVLLLVWFGGDDLMLAFSTALRDAGAGMDNAGTLEARFAGIRILAEQLPAWWLFGFGPGSLFDMDRVVTAIKVYSDPGSIFAFTVESGLPAGAAMAGVILFSVRDGLRSPHMATRGAAIGLSGFVITTLSSISPWAWGPALVIAGLVNAWTAQERRVQSSEEESRADSHSSGSS